MPAKEYDVLIVGSGHSGGMAANILTKQGVNCLMLNAGPEADFEHNRVNKAVYDLPYRGFGKPGRLPHVFQANEFNANQWVDETENPYTHDPANPYNWVRVRLLGGRSLFWARQSFRLSDFEFKAGDLDGTGENWPISHDDLAPYYSRVEEIFRVSGRKEGWPEFPDGNFVEPNYGPDSETIKRLAALGKERGMKFSKMRSSAGRTGSPARSTSCCRTRWRRASWKWSLTPSCARSPPTRRPASPMGRISWIAIRATNGTSRRAWWCWPRGRWKARGCC